MIFWGGLGFWRAWGLTKFGEVGKYRRGMRWDGGRIFGKKDRFHRHPTSCPVFHSLTLSAPSRARGVADAEIAEALVVTANTVRTHVKSLFNKLDVHNRTHAVTRANELGLL